MVETRAVAKVVIVGGGHNGLVTAALLARHGMDVTVVEKNGKVGGAAFTGHPWGPDIDMTRCSYSLGMMDQELIDELELETRFGLKKANQWGYFAPRLERISPTSRRRPAAAREGIDDQSRTQRPISLQELQAHPQEDQRNFADGKETSPAGRESNSPHARTATGVGWRDS